MKKILSIMVLSLIGINASAACISSFEKNVLKLQALVHGSVKLFVSHSDLPLGTSIEVIQNATNERVAELNSESTMVYLTQSWVPAPAPGFEVFATAAGVEKLFDEGYCFGKIG